MLSDMIFDGLYKMAEDVASYMVEDAEWLESHDDPVFYDEATYDAMFAATAPLVDLMIRLDIGADVGIPTADQLEYCKWRFFSMVIEEMMETIGEPFESPTDRLADIGMAHYIGA